MLFIQVCSDGHIKNNDGKRYDALLKLYEGRPLCISENIDVKNCIANGALAKFKGIIFKENLSVDPLEKILIDGYYVYCTDASMVKALVLEMIDGNKNKDDPKIIHLSPKKLEHMFISLFVGMAPFQDTQDVYGD